MKKRVGEVEEFAFDSLTDGSSLHITITVSGWLTTEDPDAHKEPWKHLYQSREQVYSSNWVNNQLIRSYHKYFTYHRFINKIFNEEVLGISEYKLVNVF